VADELVVGTIVAVDEHPGARAPSLLLTVDLGPHGTVEAVLPTGSYGSAELIGTQIVCRREADATVVIGAHSHGAGLVLLRPEREVEPGTLVD
jgi:tRNA-binding EMAP/Myf-like protein